MSNNKTKLLEQKTKPSKNKPNKSGSDKFLDLFAKLLHFGGALSSAELKQLQALNADTTKRLDRVKKLASNPLIQQTLKNYKLK